MYYTLPIGREDLVSAELLHLKFLHSTMNSLTTIVLFSAEELAQINNSVRYDMNQAGIPFTAASAWAFYLKLVKLCVD